MMAHTHTQRRRPFSFTPEYIAVVGSMAGICVVLLGTRGGSHNRSCYGLVTFDKSSPRRALCVPLRRCRRTTKELLQFDSQSGE